MELEAIIKILIPCCCLAAYSGYIFYPWYENYRLNKEIESLETEVEIVQLDRYVKQEELDSQIEYYNQLDEPTMHDDQELTVVGVAFQLKCPRHEVREAIMELGLMASKCATDDTYRGIVFFDKLNEDEKMKPLLDALEQAWQDGKE